MQVVNLEDVPLTVQSQARTGRLEYYYLLKGSQGTPENFAFLLGKTHSDYTTPRHRHNFDQIRFQIKGKFDFERIGDMTERTVGYFPEGTFYGPSAGNDGGLMLLLQFGGSSGNGYIDQMSEEYQHGLSELKTKGEFRDGIYSWYEEGNKHNKDAFEAVWEHVRQERVVYPKSHYSEPIIMHPDNFEWTPTENAGVTERPLGIFSEGRTRIAFSKLEPGAQFVGNPRTIYFVAHGSGTAIRESVPTAEKWSQFSTIYVEAEDHVEIIASEETEIFSISLPTNAKRRNAHL